SDRINSRKWPMIGGLLGLILGTVVFIVGTRYWHLIIARLLQGISNGVTWAMALSMITDAYPTDRHGQMMGSLFSANLVGLLVGPVFGGVLYEYGSELAPFLFTIAITAVDLAARLFVVDSVKLDTVADADANADADATASADGGDGGKATLGKMVRDAPIMICLFATMIVSGASNVIDPTLPAYLQGKFGVSPAVVGFMYFGLVIPNAIASPLIGRWVDGHQHIPKMLVAATGILLFGPLAVLLSVPNVIWLEVVFMALVGVVTSVCVVPLMPEMSTRMQELGGGATGQLFSIFNVFWAGGIILGPLIAGVLVDAIGYRKAMLVIFGILAATSIVV
ncbi:MFS general substrate transporter, partial [Ramicandelaber brevisporus]